MLVYTNAFLDNTLEYQFDVVERVAQYGHEFQCGNLLIHLFYIFICMQFVEDQQYNPEAQIFANVPTDFDYGNKHFHFMRDAPYKEKLIP